MHPRARGRAWNRTRATSRCPRWVGYEERGRTGNCCTSISRSRGIMSMRAKDCGRSGGSAVRPRLRWLLILWIAACGGDESGTEPTDDNQAPNAVGTIPAQTVTAGEVVSLDLTSYFSDPNGDALTYTATTSAPAVASPSVSGSTLTIAGVSDGSATVTVTARDPGGLTATQNVSVTVERPNTAPTASATIPAQSIEAGKEVSFNLLEYFSDPDGDALTFGASSSNSDVAAAQVSGTLLTIVGVSPGDATVTVTATDPGGLSAEQTVMVTVEEGSMDRQILTAFYIATEGAGWGTNTNWLSNGALGAWYGVTTDDRDRVTELELPENGLRNSIPRELGGLQKLVRLDLNGNRFLEGVIPRQLGDLENLEWLDLSTSLFPARGTLPPEFGKLKKLKHLDLSEIIWWVGDDPIIPSEWGDMESLEKLDLSHVGLRGKLPPQLGNLKNLKWLDISYNVFEGSIPREFMNLTLERFYWVATQQLCAPADDEFQAWLNSIPDQKGHRTCPSGG
ncbi:MAG: hypothetical protein F4X15_16105 [Gemmatimonadetes bacterium]|nr:hypothetical protein [Gemmatimonadota bacterium]